MRITERDPVRLLATPTTAALAAIVLPFTSAGRCWPQEQLDELLSEPDEPLDDEPQSDDPQDDPPSNELHDDPVSEELLHEPPSDDEPCAERRRCRGACRFRSVPRLLMIAAITTSTHTTMKIDMLSSLGR